MDTLLGHARQERERSSLEWGLSSNVGREILALLRRPAKYPSSLDDLRTQLIPSFSELQIQNAISHMLEAGVIELVYTPEFKLGVVLTKQE
jgi:hypothetical protein